MDEFDFAWWMISSTNCNNFNKSNNDEWLYWWNLTWKLSDEYWKQFRTKEEILNDLKYEQHQRGECIELDNCEFCNNEIEGS
jgi:hypothetical protein